MHYPLLLRKIHGLVHADYWEIKALLRENHKKSYTVEEIEKVCLGEVSNSLIESTSLHYIKCMDEALDNIEKCLNNIGNG